MNENSQLLSLAAHEKAGQPHAEVLALQRLSPHQKPHTIVVTLEPCHHHGKTPPCTQAILAAGVKRLVVGTRDPNSNVQGGGMEFLRSKGLEVISGVLEKECQELIEGFWVRSQWNRSMVIVKTVWNLRNSMIPAPGEKTFSSESSIRLAHEVRRSADAIFTGSGTIVADDPLFTVRKIEDFKNKTRDLIFLDRRKRVSDVWKKRQESLGFHLIEISSLEEWHHLLRQKNYLKVLVEAGPSLSESILKSDFWDLHLRIKKQSEGDDLVEKIYSKNFKNRAG